jgi:phosphatidylcholine synthase
MVIFTLFVIHASENVAFAVVLASVVLTFFPIFFLHPVRVKRLRMLNMAVFMVWSALGGVSLLMHFDAPAWVVWGVVGTGIYLYVIGFILQMFPKLGRTDS